MSGPERVLSFPRAMLVKAGTARRLPELRRVAPRRVMLDEGLDETWAWFRESM